MKVTVDKLDKNEIPFPKLMIAEDGDVVFFIEDESGVLIHKESSRSGVGYHSNAWVMKFFKDFKGKITIEQ